MKFNAFTTTIILLFPIVGKSQVVQMPQTPQAASMQPNVQIGMNPNRPVQQTPQYFGQNQVQMQNQMIIQQDLQQYNQNQQNQNLIAEAEREMLQREIHYELPDKSRLPETQFFVKAYDEINSMLDNKQDLSLKKAIFEAENAWYGGVMKYDYFCNDIAVMVDVIKTALKQEGYAMDNDLAKKWLLHRFMSDTLRLKDDRGNVTFTHLPYEYDFEDIHGKTD